MTFYYPTPTQEAYEAYRIFHSNCYNGWIHSFFMPLAVMSFFTALYGLFGSANGKRIAKVMMLLFWIGYLFYSPYIGTITILFYNLLSAELFYMLKNTESNGINKSLLLRGVLMLAIVVSIMEFVGHGYFENHHSHLLEAPNSIFHTPLYGFKSLYYPFTNQCRWN